MGLGEAGAGSCSHWRTLQQALWGGLVDREEPKSWPLIAWACIHFAWIQVVAVIIVWYFYGGVGQTIWYPSEDEIKVFNNAKVMLLPAMLLELSYLLSARNHVSGLRRASYEISYLLIFESMAKMTCYTFMAQFSGGIVHENVRASGPMRGCYSVRYLEWSIAVPMLLVINNHSLRSTESFWNFLRRLFPNFLVTWAYILTSWLGLVTPHAGAGWFLVALALVAYLIAAADQLSILRESDPDIMGRNFKVLIVAIKEGILFAYGVVYLLGIANLISSLSEQAFYTYGDVLLKVANASVIVVMRNWDDLAQLQHALEDQVQIGKQDLSRLFRRAGAPIFAIDTDGCVVAWNEHLAKVSGITEAEAFGRPVVDFVQEESQATLRQAIESCRSGLSSSAVEVVLNHVSEGPTGEGEPPAHIVLTLIVQQGCESNDMILGVGQDLTEVAHLKALQERKARFTAVLGHELRSPLHGIIGLSSTMAEVTPDMGQKRHLAMMKGCATRLLDLVTNIMEMAKAEKMEVSGAQTIAKADVNIMDIIEEVVGMTEMAVDKSGKLLIAKDVHLVNNTLESELPIVMGDQYKITQLLYNLITNAAKFTSRGTISIAAREVDGHMVEVDVADTGHGISPEGQQKIFDPFQQEQGKPSTGFQGIGLGLSVAMTIAKMHGGNIRVQSALGTGSTFTFCLPCDSTRRVRRTLCDEAECHESRSSGKGVVTMKIGSSDINEMAKARVEARVPRSSVLTVGSELPLLLSVDDDESNQEAIERVFGHEYRITRVMSGMEALEYLDSGKEFPSIVLLDLMTSGMIGLEVVRALRSQRIMHTQLPVVILSAQSPQETTAVEALQSGATDYMHRPVIKKICQELRSARASICSVEEGSDAAAQSTSAAQAVHISAQPCMLPLAAVSQTCASSAAEATASLETADNLKEERDQLRTLLESTPANPSHKFAIDENDQLRAQLSQRINLCKRAPVASKTFPVSESIVSLHSTSASSLSVDLGIAESHVDFYRAEKDAYWHEMMSLREQVGRLKSEAWLNRHRADRLERELRFVRSFIRAHL